MDAVDVGERRCADADQVGAAVLLVLIDEAVAVGLPDGCVGTAQCVAVRFDSRVATSRRCLFSGQPGSGPSSEPLPTVRNRGVLWGISN